MLFMTDVSVQFGINNNPNKKFEVKLVMNSQKLSREEATKARSETILQVGMEVFSECGFYEADVDEIAHRANVGKGTVYNHFGNKQKLFLSVVEWGLETLKDKILTAVEDITGVKNQIQAALRVYFEFFEHRKNFYRVLVHEKSNFREQMEKRFTKKYFSHLHLLENAIKRGIQSGELKRVDPHQCAVLLIGMSNALIYDWFCKETDGKLTDRITTVEEIFNDMFSGMLDDIIYRNGSINT